VGYGVSLVLLACQGLDHHPCFPLCDQEDETINDISLVGGLCFYSAVLVPVVAQCWASEPFPSARGRVL
jgi:hypothetical protein